MNLIDTNKIYFIIGLLSSALILSACDSSTSGNQDDTGFDPDWLIPSDEVVDGGPGKDGIPSIDNPQFTPMNEVDFLDDDRLVIGIKINEEIRLYPHQILDWHEIVNDQIDDEKFSLTYCPLTGTGIAYNRVINEEENEFGVSGLLFRNNLIMYDRNTDSRWSQMQIRSVHGPLKGQSGDVLQTLETTWGTWKKLLTDAKVLNMSTGYGRNYRGYAYGESYLNDHNDFIFPKKNNDPRLKNKSLVHAIMLGNYSGESTSMRVYPINQFEDSTLVINEEYDQEELVYVSNSGLSIGKSFFRTLADGSVLEFEAVQNSLPVVMKDQEGNNWNIFGEAVSGPRAGTKLQAPKSYNGYWFAFADHFPASCVYPNSENCRPQNGK